MRIIYWFILFISLGNGLCCSYDAVGSFEHVKYTSSGTGNQLVQPLLDNQVCIMFLWLCKK